MLSIFKKLFGKPEPKAVAVTPQAVPAPASTPIPTIEVAHLSLPAIIERFPEELKPLLNGTPAADATVALPIPTILKQLPTGAVKMSLASLHRQAHGLIKPLPPGDKRSVDIPLVEIFRHVRMDLLRRRPDQRYMDIPEIGFNLFGDNANPYAVAPDDQMSVVDASSIPEAEVLDLTEDISDAQAQTQAPVPVPLPRVLKMDDGLKAHFGNGHGNGHDAEQDPAEAAPVEVKPRIVAPPQGWAAPAPATPAPSAPTATPVPRVPAVQAPAAPAPAAPAPAAPAPAAATPPPATPPPPAAAPTTGPAETRLTLSLTSISGGWPEEIRTELAGLDPATTVSLPAEELSAGLARGRVNFTWGQIQSWLNPPCSTPSAVAGEALLQLPLKVVAPAFLASTKKPAGERKTVALDESIPTLFNDARPPAEVPAARTPDPEPAAAPAEEAAPAPVEEPAPHEPPEQPAAHATEHRHEHGASSIEKLPETVGEIFHQPQKQHWTPAEIVSGTVTLPGVAGAIVALQEGLVVSAFLPEGVKSDVIAAFLPQIFARLNQYAGEMRLGDVDDLLFTTHGAHCQIYRLGYIYFAVLGKTGESLPWHELRLLTEELARQTHK
ncbi:MAG TPA: hypothetical protein VGM54_06360 [Chthoniobacter sp.]